MHTIEILKIQCLLARINRSCSVRHLQIDSTVVENMLDKHHFL